MGYEENGVPRTDIRRGFQDQDEPKYILLETVDGGDRAKDKAVKITETNDAFGGKHLEVYNSDSTAQRYGVSFLIVITALEFF